MHTALQGLCKHKMFNFINTPANVILTELICTPKQKAKHIN